MRIAEHVTREINLIARNLACLGDKEASAATADHLRRFWAPLLRAELQSVVRAHPERFSPIALAAIRTLELAAQNAPGLVQSSQSDRATSADRSPRLGPPTLQVNFQCEDAR